jgi:MFS family permease
MGAVQTLSLTVLGEIVSPRERGRYMGYLGAVFGVALVAGPLAGGWIADALSWRWLFYANLPLAVAALAFVAAFLRLPHVRGKRNLDHVGFVTLGLGLCALLLATTWGGTLYPWGSWQILSLYVASGALLAGFAVNETRAREPVLPPRLWKDPVFALSNVSNMAVGMVMYGVVFFVPLYAQGVVGVSVKGSGAVLVPLLLSAVTTSIVVGRLITATGRYKAFVLAGLLVLMASYALLAGLRYGSARADLTLASVVVGVGLGAVLQTYTLVVQNAASRQDLGVVTSVSQLARSTGAAFGPALFGAVMAARMETEISARLSRGASGGNGIGSVLDPGAIGGLPAAIVVGVREGLAAAMHSVFLVGLSIVAIALVASAFIRELPLRDTAYADEDTGSGLPGEPDGGTTDGAGSPVLHGRGRKP